MTRESGGKGGKGAGPAVTGSAGFNPAENYGVTYIFGKYRGGGGEGVE